MPAALLYSSWALTALARRSSSSRSMTGAGEAARDAGLAAGVAALAAGAGADTMPAWALYACWARMALARRSCSSRSISALEEGDGETDLAAGAAAAAGFTPCCSAKALALYSCWARIARALRSASLVSTTWVLTSRVASWTALSCG